jgi:hypothetical protein
MMNTNRTMTVSEQRVEDINQRVYMRNLPSGPLRPSFSNRPVSTKYTHFQTYTHSNSQSTTNENQTHTNLQYPIVYHPSRIYQAGASRGVWEGFARHVDDETILRNQHILLSKEDVNQWVPSSQSDLYQSPNTYSQQRQENQPFPHLWREEQFNSFQPNLHKEHLGTHLWANHTRQQLKIVNE